jgi:toxin-antitoxin system PIN domain toxin
LNDSPVLFDANVWIAMSFASHVHHESATELFQQTTSEHQAVFCRATQQAFLRIASNPTFLRLAHAPPITNADALAALRQIMSLPSVTFRDEPPGLETIWFRLGARNVPAHNVWMDAYLAAFAMAASLPLATFDKGFKDFEAHGLNLNLLQS